ncbi:hypothetical protein GYH30_004436 [Glycine max]|nr:hypothetical protein GYH30_004436 [Glycine max]
MFFVVYLVVGLLFIPSIDYIVCILQGDQIHVVCKANQLKSWKAYLKENSTYVMHNFKVVKNDGQFRVCEHQYKLVFIGVTLLEKLICMSCLFKGILDLLNLEMSLVGILWLACWLVLFGMSHQKYRVVFK